jgi:hypothetical protein
MSPPTVLMWCGALWVLLSTVSPRRPKKVMRPRRAVVIASANFAQLSGKCVLVYSRGLLRRCLAHCVMRQSGT